MNGTSDRRSSMAAAKEALQLSVDATKGNGADRRASVDSSEKGEYRRVQNDLQIMAFRVRSLEEKLQKLVKETGVESCLGGKTVAFCVRLQQNASVSSLETVMFDDVLTNNGNFYNPETGVFKVPYSGRYLLSLTVRAQYQKQATAEIVVEPMVLGQVTAGDTEIDNATSTITIVASLEKGDEVFVRNVKTWAGHYVGDGYSVFTGLMLE